ncbi:RibD family protein [Catellatospora sichuanensis]|uniref:RibD family protein n=1 Tax=Catellatospora sichuanensis TaxID=1969805 RepID=UPI001183787B|nr:dihydrofolate reductase family protein [Catellatospora sichuanensis]
MTDRPYVLLKAAVSVDGYLDDSSAQRLLLSSPEDFAAVDELRAGVDAILVGASTLRADNPRLMVRSAQLRQKRLADGLPETPAKVTISRSIDLDPQLPFFTTGDCDKIVYVPDAAAGTAGQRLGAVAHIVGAGDPISLPKVLADLHRRGIRRLMIEGGSTVHTQFLADGLVDEIRLSIAPFFVGDSSAPRLAGDAAFPFGSGRRMHLAQVSHEGDCVIVRYLLGEPADKP